MNTDEKGLVTLMNDKGKEVVSYYQVSLKKGFEDARIGRVTTFVNKNFAGGISLGSPTQAASVAQDFQTEGFFGDVFSKFKDIVSGGFKNFVGWVKKKYTKIAQVLAGVVVKLYNQMIKSNRGIKSISHVVNMSQLNESS